VPELDVEGRGVAECESSGSGDRLRPQRQERGVLQLAEGPLVRVRDERDRLGCDDGVRTRRVRLVDADGLVGDEQAAALEIRKQAGRVQVVPACTERPIDLPEEAA